MLRKDGGDAAKRQRGVFLILVERTRGAMSELQAYKSTRRVLRHPSSDIACRREERTINVSTLSISYYRIYRFSYGHLTYPQASTSRKMQHP